MDRNYTLKAIFEVIPPPLSASISPLSASIILGQSVTFTSTVSGGKSPYLYQWYLNGSGISGAVNPTWTFTPTTFGTYKIYLTVTDSLGSTTSSNEAIVTAASQLTVSISPLNASILVGQSVTFTSTVSGGYMPYSYQWYLNGAPVPGVTSSSLIFTLTSSGIYYVHLKVTDAKGNTAQSDAARITAATVPVGGYSIPIQLPTIAKPVTVHIALLTILTAIFVTIKRRAKRKTKFRAQVRECPVKD
jgi:PKD repeat protein